MTRREFIVTSAAAAGATACANWSEAMPALVSSEARRERPNILLILTDEQQAHAMSCAGMAGLRTPAIDRLAARGLRFEQAYAFQPLCVPSRTSLMTGQPPRRFGTRVNNLLPRVPPGTPLLGRIMADAGYETAYVGKWHVPIAATARSEHGFGTMRAIADVGRNDCRVARPCDRILRQSRRRPLFCVASIINPHDICEFVQRYPLPNGRLPAPPGMDECPPLPSNHAVGPDEPEILRNVRRFTTEAYPTLDWREREWRQYLWAYRRLIERADGLVGSILDSLTSARRDGDTLVLFASDHGEGGGGHCWNQKTALYEESVRVPLIAAGPGVDGNGRVDRDHLVSLLDVLPTACDYAGARAPSACPGRSLRPLIEGRSAAWRETVIAETEFPQFTRTSLPSGLRGWMARSSRYKYIAYSAGANREQLFDLQADPGETRNLIANAALAGEVRRHRSCLAEWSRATGGDFAGLMA